MTSHEATPESRPAPPRADEQLELERLAPYLREHLPRTGERLEVLQFPGGKANLTYLLKYENVEYVLRRPPLGPVAPGAHDMGREYRVLSRLSKHFPLAPDCYLYCEDESIIGAPFQVMERRHGQVIFTTLPPVLQQDMALRRAVGDMLVDVLARLHRVDRVAAGLADLGRPEGFVGRQLDGWAKRWQAAAHEPVPAIERLMSWLQRGLPSSDAVSLLHNDYKLDNVIVGVDDPSRAVAVLDWDMCTSGDPLMDLGYLLNQWVEPEDDPAWISASLMPTGEGGFGSREDAVQRYAQATGLNVDQIDWYHAFAAFKFAVVMQQIYIRYHRGQTQDERFAGYGQRARDYIDKGCVIAGLARD
ncbi:MAG: phosphotransferase family protein [Gammaproteobacteria bacterium]|nr:phosphotransferase family protein [Gammaproteobacteria bacterium]